MSLLRILSMMLSIRVDTETYRYRKKPPRSGVSEAPNHLSPIITSSVLFGTSRNSRMNSGTLRTEMALPGRGHSPLRNQEQLQEDDEDEERSHFTCETEIDDQVLRLRYSGFTPTPEQIASFSAFDLYFDSEFSNSSPSRIISNRFECLFYDGIVHCFRCGTTWEEMLMKLVRGVPQKWCRRAPGIALELAQLLIPELEVKFLWWAAGEGLLPGVASDTQRGFDAPRGVSGEDSGALPDQKRE